jgi:hypothetical protein
MAAAKKQKSGICVYCGREGPITDDHAPPRSFYPDPPPKNLITVPCCEACNKSFAKDDDYVRLIFTTAEGLMDNPARNALLPTVKRFAERKESKNILSSLHRSLESGYYPTASGVLTKRQRFVIDGERLDAFAKRIVKAVFYREKGYPVPSGYMIHAINYRGFAEAQRVSGPNADFYQFILHELISAEAQSWGGAFAYSWIQSPNDSNATWWLLEFFGKRMYLCNTFSDVSLPAQFT